MDPDPLSSSFNECRFGRERLKKPNNEIVDNYHSNFFLKLNTNWEQKHNFHFSVQRYLLEVLSYTRSFVKLDPDPHQDSDPPNEFRQTAVSI